MAKQEKVQVDEDFMKEIISQGLPMKQEISPKAVSKSTLNITVRSVITILRLYLLHGLTNAP